MECDEGMIFKNSISYLHRLSQALPNTCPSLNSYYATKSRLLELRSNSFLPAKLTNATVRCTKCCLSFDDYPPSIRLKPKLKVSRFSRKILKKLQRNKPLTCYQQTHSKSRNISNKEYNLLSKVCQICKQESNTILKIEDDKYIQETRPLVTQVKKKKKRKDKFCGLKKNAVLACMKDESKKEEKTPIKHNMGNKKVAVSTPKSKENKKSKGKQRKSNLIDKEKSILTSKKDESKKEENTPIKYNLIGKIESLKTQRSKKKKKNKQPVVQRKTTSQKIMDRKEKKIKRKLQLGLKEMLNTSGKSKTSNALQNFLQDL